MRLRTVVVLASVALAPALTWAAFKPMRVLAPELLGLQCSHENVCVDDPARFVEATRLRDDALVFVDQRIGGIDHSPRVVFCSSPRCAKAYGFTTQAAYSVGTVGVVVSPRGWHDYYVRHEFIHQVQAQHLGSVNMWLFKPDWLLEGMAYSFSEDPRHPLPEPLESWRARFDQWYLSVGPNKLWQAAAAE